MDEPVRQQIGCALFCWNIGNPSLQRAAKQAEWLRKRPEDIFVLTEAKRSQGCTFLERYFLAYGYQVLSSSMGENEYGVLIVSKAGKHLERGGFAGALTYLPSRVLSVRLLLGQEPLEIIGAYVPSRDASPEKIQRKRTFLDELGRALSTAPASEKRIFCGDLNILEPDHRPSYPFFERWEYAFYQGLADAALIDAFRLLHPDRQEYSWVGRAGDGYRYDHCFISPALAPSLQQASYLHEPREQRLSDHSALICSFT